MVNVEKILEKINKLEAEVVSLLEKSGLVKGVCIGGEITKSDSPLYLQYHVKKGKKINAQIRFIRGSISTRIKKNHPEVLDLEKAYDSSGRRREYIRINPHAKIGDGISLKYQLLQDFKKEIKNYGKKV